MRVTTKEQACKAATLIKEPKQEPLLRSLQQANIQAIADISGSLGCPKTRGTPEWRYNLQNDGPAMAAAMTKYINSATASADIKDMITKAKSYGPSILAKMDPPVAITVNDTQVRVRFNWTTQSAYVRGVFGDGNWNAYFNLDIGKAGFADGRKVAGIVKGKEYQEIIAITFHTKIDVQNRGHEGSFHLKQKVGPNPQTTIRYRICKQVGNKIQISEAYTLNKGKEVADLIYPFDTLVRQVVEDYLNNACKVPVVPRPPPPPPPPKAPSPKAPSPKAPSPKAPSPKAVVYAKGMDPSAAEFVPGKKTESVANPSPVVIPAAVKPTFNESTMKIMKYAGISDNILQSFNVKPVNKAANTTHKNSILAGLVPLKKKGNNNNMNFFKGTKKNKNKNKPKVNTSKALAASLFTTPPVDSRHYKRTHAKSKPGNRTRKNRS